MLVMNCSRMVKDNIKTFISSLVVTIFVSGSCKITIEASSICLHYCNTRYSGASIGFEHQTCCKSCGNACSLKCNEDLCAHSCDSNAQACGLECNKKTCKQTCNSGQCSLKCRGQSCDQTCSGSNRCSLRCHGENCAQTCQAGECTLDCKAGSCHQTCSRNCLMNCYGKHCEQSCDGLKAGASCQLKYDDVKNQRQYCQGRENQCTKFIASTKAPTAVPSYSLVFTGTPLPISTPESTTALSASALSSTTAALSSSAVVATSPLSQSSAPLTTSIAFTSISLASALSRLSFSTTTQSLAPTRTLSDPSSPETTTMTNNTSRTEELVMKFLSTLDRTDVQQESSLQDAVNSLENTTEQLKNISAHELQLRLLTEQKQKSLIFKVAFTFEEFAMKYGRYHLNESKPQLSNNYNTLALRIERVFHQNSRDFHLEGPQKRNFINIPSTNIHNNGSVLLGIVYKNLHELLTLSLPNKDATKKKRCLDSIIMAATMDPKPEKLQQNIALNFRNLEYVGGNMFCMFWNGYSKQNPYGWSEEGCHVAESKSNSGETECSCNHLTHFAVLFDLGDNMEITKSDEEILKILTFVGLALSIAGITLTIICYVSFTDVHQPLSQIRVSLTGSLGAAQIIFLAGINTTRNTSACVTVAVLMQYFLMAAFCWMLVEGIYLYLFVVKVYNINNKMTIYHVMSWGLPVVIVAISLSTAAGKDGIQSLVSVEHCWFSTASHLNWIFVSFVVIIEVVNLLILVRVIKEMTTMQSTGDSHFQQIRLSIKACVVMIPLLGVTWLFGLLSPLHKAFVYMFTILNSVQGFLIFLLHCVRNSQIKDRFRRKINSIFPSAEDQKLTTRTSQVNKRDISRIKAIEVQSCSKSVFELEQR